MHVEILRKCVSSVVYVLCVIGCVWLCKGQWDKYYAKQTIVWDRWELSTVKRQLPLFLFCRKNPIQTQVIKGVINKFNPWASHENVMAIKPPSMSLTGLLQHFEGDPTPLTKDTEFDAQTFYTRHLGICKAFNIKRKVWGREYIQFKASEDLTGIVLFILEHREMAYAVIGEFIRKISATYMDGKTQVLLITPKETTAISRPNRLCYDYKRYDDYLWCKEAVVARKVNESGFDCVSGMIKKVLPQWFSHLNECIPVDTNVNVWRMISHSFLHAQAAECTTPCMEPSYDLSTYPLSAVDLFTLAQTNKTFAKEGAIQEFFGRSRLYVAFNSNYTLISEEQYLYDLNAIFSAVGGGLGLCIGISCYGMFEVFVDTIIKIIKLFNPTPQT